MKCDHCDREATVHEVTVRNGVKIERHLCEVCAEQQGIAIQSGAQPINELIKQYVLQQGLIPAAQTQPSQTVQRASACPVCKTTFSDFKQHGILGCDNCYKAFEGLWGPLLARPHEGGVRHTGKTPKRLAATGEGASAGQRGMLTLEERAQRLRSLRRELESAVHDERYELAAKLRDELRKLESAPGPATAGPTPTPTPADS